MGLGFNYRCACGYSAMVYTGPMMFTGDAWFVGATCDSCRELVSVPRGRRARRGQPEIKGQERCETCNSPVRLLKDQDRVCCPRCGRHDGWEPIYTMMVD